MVIKTKRIKLSPGDILNLLDDTAREFGSCCRTAIFNALSYRTNSERAKWIRQTATTQYKGRIIREEKIV